MRVTAARPPHSSLIMAGPRASAERWTRFVRADQIHRNARLVEAIRETADARTLVFECMDGQPVVASAGQFMTLQLDIDGQRYKRAYSLSQAPAGNRFAVTVKHVPGGRVSALLNEQLMAGDSVQFNGPSGDFTLPAVSAPHYVFAAAGSGITPVMCMMEALVAAAGKASPGITLVYGNRHANDIIFADRLQALAARHPALKIVHVLSKPARGWKGARGRISADHLLQETGNVTAAHYFLCGPGDFNDSLRASLEAAGIDRTRIHAELFTQGARESRPHPADPHPAEFAMADGESREVIVRPGESLLEAGLRAGLPLPFSCTMGGCGHCRVTRQSGDIAMDQPNCLTEAEVASGAVLACCAYPHGRVAVSVGERLP